LLRKTLDNEFTIISVGGVETADEVLERVSNGATLVQGYSGFVYEGPLWARKIKKEIN
jgi:dihydroorotate dehydrogenase